MEIKIINRLLIKNKFIIIYLFLFLFFLILITFYFGNDFSKEVLKEKFFYLNDFKKKYHLFTFILSFIISTFLSFLGFSLPILIFNGFLFGPINGSILSLISLTLGSYIFYRFNKNLIKPKIKNKFKKTFSKIFKLVNKNEFLAVFFLRFFGFGMPFIIHNVLPMLFNIKNKNFLLGSFFGLIPLTMQSFIAGGFKVFYEKNNSFTDIFSEKSIFLPIILIITILICSILITKKIYKK